MMPRGELVYDLSSTESSVGPIACANVRNRRKRDQQQHPYKDTVTSRAATTHHRIRLGLGYCCV